MRIVELKTENFMGIKLAEIKPDGDMVVIGGRNGQGKTSLLDSIECAIRGKKFHPNKPVREGADIGEVSLDLGDLKIRRRFNSDGSGTITVERKDGFKAPRPQEVLDSLAGAISFDPLDFARMDPKARLGLVRKLSGVDTSDIETRRQDFFDERSSVNRATKVLEARVSGLDHFPDAPAELVAIKDLLEELDRAQENNRDRLQLDQKRQEALEDVHRNRSAIERIESELSDAKVDLVNNDKHLADVEQKFDAMTEIECDHIHKQIEQAETTNQQVSANARFAEEAQEAKGSAEYADKLTLSIKSLDEQKAEMIAGASLPVPGLSFSEADGVTLDGIPFEQRSSAEKLDASIRIGMALNPKLHLMLVRDGCVLDEDSMKRLGEMAQAEGYQLFVERVGTGDAGAIVIEGGEIVAQEDAA